MTKTIVTHTSPDWDAIGAVWLLKRFGGLDDAYVLFVNTGAPDADSLESATAVVDTGKEYDAARLRFDHHQLPGEQASNTCAAFQVFQHVAPDGALAYLAPLNALILNGDTGSRAYGAEWSRLTGIHALLSVRKARKADDLALLDWGCAVLDDIAEHLKARYQARALLETHTVYSSADGMVIALKDAPPHATSAAHEAGARLVLFQSSSEDTNAIGIMRAGEWQEPHIGGLVSWLLNDADCGAGPIEHGDAIYMELRSWFRHNGGFFAGRGTAKAPDPRPIEVELAVIAAAIDKAWTR